MQYTKMIKSLIVAGLVAYSLPGHTDDMVRTIVAEKGNVHIEALDQGKGHVIVILPSKGRGANDYDEVARYLVGDGYRVIRPELAVSRAARRPWIRRRCTILRPTSPW